VIVKNPRGKEEITRGRVFGGSTTGSPTREGKHFQTAKKQERPLCANKKKKTGGPTTQDGEHGKRENAQGVRPKNSDGTKILQTARGGGGETLAGKRGPPSPKKMKKKKELLEEGPGGKNFHFQKKKGGDVGKGFLRRANRSSPLS